MIKNVKTSYFLRIIFDFMDEKQKLKLIKYNKGLQFTMNISLINYKIFSGKYIIYEETGKGKECDYDGRLLYEGEYLNGEKNGKGKEYYRLDGKLKFEGEYINGKRIGKGKEYWKGDLIFEGQYRHNRRYKGKVYDGNGNIIYELNKENNIVKEYWCDKLTFEGEYLNGLRNGKGKEYDLFEAKLKFEGEYINGKRNGKGKEFYNDGKLKFEGIYLIDKKWGGKGYDKFNNIVYELKEGKGLIKEYTFSGDLIFEGPYLNGLRNGKGKEYNDGNLIFEGEYLNGLRNGKGKEYDNHGNLIFEGEYLNGYLNLELL